MPMLDAKERKSRYRQLAAALLNDRSSFDAHWRDVADFILPTRSRFFTQDRNKGHKRNQNIIDSTGTFAAATLESGMHAGLTSPARPWMLLTTPDPDLAAFAPVKEWLHIVTQRMMAVFAASNLYKALPIVYGDMGTFATAAMAVLEDREDLFRCYTYPIGSYSLAVDDRGQVVTFVREVEMSVRQVVSQFGGKNGFPLGRNEAIDWTNISQRVKDHWSQSRYEVPVDVTWIVTPNDWVDRTKLYSKYLPFASCYFEKGSDDKNAEGTVTGFLREAGFAEFPLMAPRWKVISHEDSYGTECPGMRALGDVRQLQHMEKRLAQGINKMVDPSLQAPTSLRNRPISILPGHVTHVDVREGMQGVRPIHEVNINLEHFSINEDRVRFRIQRAYYEDLFLMLATRDQTQDGKQPITAREIAERHEEKLLALGPVLESANDELLEPLVDRTYALMDAAGMIPEPPEDVRGVNLKVEFISILAQAQKSVGVAAQDRFMQTILGVAEVFPEARNKINVNRYIDNTGTMLGVDPRIIRSDEEADAITAEQAQQQQAMAEAQQARELSQAAQAAGQTPMGGDTALARVVDGMQQQGAA